MTTQGIKILEQKHSIELIISLCESNKGFNLLQSESKVNSSTLHKRLMSLEKNKIIIKKACPNDGRSYFYSATAKGKKIAEALLRIQDTFLDTE